MKPWILLFLLPFSLTADELAWQAWRYGNAVLIMRHALAPGTGDPAGFVLQDCSTQRNLNARGRQQAQAWGHLLQQKTAADVQIFSSEWCRSLETGQLMALSAVEPLPLLNSFFAGRGDRQAQTSALKVFLAQAPFSTPTVLISHQVNITALTGIFPASGEGLLLALPLTEPITVLARVQPD
ncbi:histidine phosphatase family protein [Alkalimonas amylolytica]|uniref:Histidine phosphatase superfamily (Branch 1) n=1 Tax=Alkalimonas amylolytica TaxID=152573 RepID=A0A1H4FEW9_ALKAM|nr:histidine phosphatase family protein [Alkalimonas amylolytica]SEA95899.1 Histidine phosphatase superfamily (branch 1) [Alkalimonas amylolytica]